MMEPDESFQLSCPLPFSNTELSLDEYVNYALGVDAHEHHFDQFSPPSATITGSPFQEFLDVPVHADKMDVTFPFDEPFPVLDLEELELIWRDEFQNIISGWLKGADEESNSLISSLSPSIISSDVSTDGILMTQQSLILPTGDMEINNQLTLNHLAKAYKEALENKEAELAEVIMGRINEKVSPIGEIGERLLYYLFQPLDQQADHYLKQESKNNFTKGLEAFYQIFPYGMIAHFTANSAILEAKPHDAEVLHVVDFDMGEGLQWASMIMTLGQRQNQQNSGHVPQQTTLKLTAIKWEEEDSGHVYSWRRFQETKRQLEDCANLLGLVLKVEEVELQELVSEIKRMRERGGRREWLAFNCMRELPHMGRRRNRRHVWEFLRLAKDLLANYSAYSNTNDRGIVIFGNGDAWEMGKSCPAGFGLFFDSFMEHFQALLESIEWNFPFRLAEARMVMECLFVVPYVSSLAWMQKWEEIKESSCDFNMGFGFEELRMNNESLTEAKEMVREGETPYEVRIKGDNNNEIVLEWRGTALVRVSAWK